MTGRLVLAALALLGCATSPVAPIFADVEDASADDAGATDFESPSSGCQVIEPPSVCDFYEQNNPWPTLSLVEYPIECPSAQDPRRCVAYSINPKDPSTAARCCTADGGSLVP